MTYRRIDSADERKRRLLEGRNADGWGGRSEAYPPGPGGLRYRCSTCDAVFGGRSGAMKHERGYPGCVVLRVDWLEPGYLELLRQRATVEVEP